ncbi:MAG: Maf-like protein [Tannerellaceae bacterium]
MINYKIILASASPRRKELLRGLDIDFEVRLKPSLEESYPDTLQSDEIPVYLAEKKADAYRADLAADELLITADTIVWTFERVLGKPTTREEALAMLRLLSGHAHEVITGVCLVSCEKTLSFSVASAVAFAELSEEDISYYVDKYRPYDKAGAYGIQEWIGYVGVEAINGSFYNVMGLPVQRLYQELKKF